MRSRTGSRRRTSTVPLHHAFVARHPYSLRLPHHIVLLCTVDARLLFEQILARHGCELHREPFSTLDAPIVGRRRARRIRQIQIDVLSNRICKRPQRFIGSLRP
jgi:hypothetical protein